MDYTEYTKFFIALLAIVDPLAALPVYFATTGKMDDPQKRKLAALLGLTIAITLWVSLYLGETILQFFGISSGSFRVASGLLLMVMAYQMFASSGPEALVNHSEQSSASAVVPLAIPLLAGPGAMSTVIVYATHYHALSHYLWLSLCIGLLGLVVWLYLRTASVLVKKISPLFLAISSKIMGLIIAAIAVEFITNGVRLLVA